MTAICGLVSSLGFARGAWLLIWTCAWVRRTEERPLVCAELRRVRSNGLTSGRRWSRPCCGNWWATCRTNTPGCLPCASAFYRHFKHACADLGLSKSYVPHSLRHGGATHDFLRGLSLEDILHIGRWASIKSARHYVQEGRALLLSTSVPRDISALSRVLVPRILLAMSLTQ